jgi:HD-GYP domain-containing protein (c-di-GMP phosphodiesterase class II)
VVDCFDALTSDRPYRRAMTSEAAIAILMDRRGKMYDPDVVDAFVRIQHRPRCARASARQTRCLRS